MNEIITVHGGHKLYGTVDIAGSKNAALACIAAACLVTDKTPILLENVPNISDINIMCDIIRGLGKDADFRDGKLCISGEFSNFVVPSNLSGKIRGSMYFFGLLAAAMGEFKCGLPGGDQIGERPVDIHMFGLKKLGCDCNIVNGVVEGKVSNGQMEGTKIYLKYPSVGATCNLMIAASKANGRTVIENAAKEPEIVDMGNLLNEMGVKVIGAGTDRITIIGTQEIHGGITHEVIADRIEAGVIAIATTICGGEVRLNNALPYHSYPLLSLLGESGAEIEELDDGIIVRSEGNPKPVEVEMMPFPGVATDLQATVSVMATCADGVSTIVDHVFQDRFSYVDELRNMGAFIERHGNTLKIYGGKKLTGTKVSGGDIRAVSALICAGLAADGETIVDGVSHLRRGYPELDRKFRALGADVVIKSE